MRRAACVHLLLDRIGDRCFGCPYPYRFSHADVTVFSRRLKSRLFVPPIRLPVLGRTYGTYLHYERSYPINVFFYSELRGAEAPV